MTAQTEDVQFYSQVWQRYEDDGRGEKPLRILAKQLGLDHTHVVLNPPNSFDDLMEKIRSKFYVDVSACHPEPH